MKIVENDHFFHLDGSVVALGTFDGVHCAHRVLLQKAVQLAKETALPAVVYTFRNHPQSVIAPQNMPPLLTSFSEKAQLLADLGIDYLYAVPFDEALMIQPAEVFAGELVRRFHPKHIVCGYNYTFGSTGSGKPVFLQMLGNSLNFNCSIVPQIKIGDMNISSSEIRKAIAEGDDSKASLLLGRPYSFELLKTENKYQMADSCKQAPSSGIHRVILTLNQRSIPANLFVSEQWDMKLSAVPICSNQIIQCALLKKIK